MLSATATDRTILLLSETAIDYIDMSSSRYEIKRTAMTVQLYLLIGTKLYNLEMKTCYFSVRLTCFFNVLWPFLWHIFFVLLIMDLFYIYNSMNKIHNFYKSNNFSFDCYLSFKSLLKLKDQYYFQMQCCVRI